MALIALRLLIVNVSYRLSGWLITEDDYDFAWFMSNQDALGIQLVNVFFTSVHL